MQKDIKADFAHVETWVFDLDNTLYPAHCNLFAQIDRRMGEFISSYLGTDHVEAKRIQKHYYHTYGTTLHGLMSQHGMEPKAFLDYVHDIDHGVLTNDIALDEALARLPGRKYVFTNGSVKHAEAVLGKIGVAGHFDDIFDIVAAEYVPKPSAETYRRFVDATGIAPGVSAMFEDIAVNLREAHALGMRTVLVRSPEDFRTSGTVEWDGKGAGDPHVHHVAEDLAAFLDEVVSTEAGDAG